MSRASVAVPLGGLGGGGGGASAASSARLNGLPEAPSIDYPPTMGGGSTPSETAIQAPWKEPQMPSLYGPEKMWYKVVSKKGAIVRETQGMTSSVVTELACGTHVVVERMAIIKHDNKDLRRMRITVPKEGWMSAKNLRVSEEKHGKGAPDPHRPKKEKAATAAPPRRKKADPDDENVALMQELHARKRAAAKERDRGLTDEAVAARVKAALEASSAKNQSLEARTATVGTGKEGSRAVVLGYFGARVDLLSTFTTHWKGLGYGVRAYVPAPGDDYEERRRDLASYLSGADRVVFHALSNNGYHFLNACFRDAAFAEAMKGKAFVALDSCPEVPRADAADRYRETVVRAVTAMVCQVHDEAPDPKHARYHPEVARQFADVPLQAHALAGDALPLWLPVLVVYSEADAVIDHGKIDAYLDSRDDATGICKFHDTPHVTSFALRPRAYATYLENLVAGFYIPRKAKPMYFANAKLGLRGANTHGPGDRRLD